MEKKMLDIAYEKRLIDLLGYTIIGPNNSNRWIILENNNPVGFIQYKKVKKSSKKNPATYAHCTEIDSSTISYSKIREDESNNICDKYFYELYIKRENDNLDYCGLEFGDEPSINTRSKNGYRQFYLKNGILKINVKSKNETGELIEFINYDTNISTNLKFRYDIISNAEYTSHVSMEINADEYLMRKKQIEVREQFAINNLPTSLHINTIDGTIEEAVLKNDMALETLNKVKESISNELPFEENIFDVLVTEEIIESNGSRIKSFFDEANKIKKKKTLSN